MGEWYHRRGGLWEGVIKDSFKCQEMTSFFVIMEVDVG